MDVSLPTSPHMLLVRLVWSCLIFAFTRMILERFYLLFEICKTMTTRNRQKTNVIKSNRFWISPVQKCGWIFFTFIFILEREENARVWRSCMHVQVEWGEKKFLLCSHSLTILHEEQVCVSHLLSASNCSAGSGEVWRRPEQNLKPKAVTLSSACPAFCHSVIIYLHLNSRPLLHPCTCDAQNT